MEVGDWFVLHLERSDATFRIEHDGETADGKKSKLFTSAVELFLDSEESAQRLGRAFIHGITLSGGKPAPF
jgi:hypothetical protein